MVLAGCWAAVDGLPAVVARVFGRLGRVVCAWAAWAGVAEPAVCAPRSFGRLDFGLGVADYSRERVVQGCDG